MSEQDTNREIHPDDILRMTSDIVASFVSNNPVPADSLPEVIRSVHKTVADLSSPVVEKVEERPKPAVAIRSSVQDDHIVCLEDGKKLKMLKRYLRTHYGMTPEEYRKRWNLPADYPMVAPNYTRTRSKLAKEIGLGRGNAKKDA